MGLSAHERISISTIKSGSLIKQHHLFRLTLGMHVGDNFEGGIALYEGHLHVERSEIDSQNGLSKDIGKKKG